jgi:hypothetical protein
MIYSFRGLVVGTLMQWKVFIRTPPFFGKPTKKGDAELKNCPDRRAPGRNPAGNFIFGPEKLKWKFKSRADYISTNRIKSSSNF